MVLTIAKRLGAMVLTLLIASFVIYAALSLAPGSEIQTLTGGRPLSPEAKAALAAQYHLDDPFFQRYFLWLSDVLHGDLGRSTIFQQDVWVLLKPRIATTLWLLIYAAVLTLAVGVGLGVLAGLRGGLVRSTVTVSTAIAMAIPAFVAAVLLSILFSVELGWFPVSGAGSGFADRIQHLTLPAVALAMAGAAYVARLTRAAVAAEYGRDHVRTAVARGVPMPLVVRRHVLRNAAIPISTVAGITIASLIAGTVVVEQAFQLDGLGSFLVKAVDGRDFAVVQAITLLLVAAFVVVNTVVDSLYGVLDPRLRGRT
jgi:peptide/nickel transport system permease protein